MAMETVSKGVNVMESKKKEFDYLIELERAFIAVTYVIALLSIIVLIFTIVLCTLCMIYGMDKKLVGVCIALTYGGYIVITIILAVLWSSINDKLKCRYGR